MNESRPYASLSSGLLARKGAAKPAMRPQGFTGFEDLGWNDMGYEAGDAGNEAAPEHVPSSIAALTPAPRSGQAEPPAITAVAAVEAEPAEVEAEPAEVEAEPAAVEAEPPQEEIAPEPERPAPSVVAQQRAILEQYDGEEEPVAEAPTLPAKPRRAARAQVVPLPNRAAVAATAGRKAAFTLRLDADRHLRLRLACAVTGHSAQQIVTGALDAALADIPEIEVLAARVPAGATRN